jgi:hypothetical protein
MHPYITTHTLPSHIAPALHQPALPPLATTAFPGGHDKKQTKGRCRFPPRFLTADRRPLPLPCTCTADQLAAGGGPRPCGAAAAAAAAELKCITYYVLRITQIQIQDTAGSRQPAARGPAEARGSAPIFHLIPDIFFIYPVPGCLPWAMQMQARAYTPLLYCVLRASRSHLADHRY